MTRRAQANLRADVVRAAADAEAVRPAEWQLSGAAAALGALLQALLTPAGAAGGAVVPAAVAGARGT